MKSPRTLIFRYVPHASWVDLLVVLAVVDYRLPHAWVRTVESLRVVVHAIDVNSAGAVDVASTWAWVVVRPGESC
jgi:hypothetical protein